MQLVAEFYGHGENDGFDSYSVYVTLVFAITETSKL